MYISIHFDGYKSLSTTINAASNLVLSNPCFIDEYTGITATSTVHSYYPHERYHQTPEKQTENPKIPYCIMTWLHMYFK